jgi:hypothetical protein
MEGLLPRSKRNAVADMVDLDIRLAPVESPQGPEKNTFSLQSSLRVHVAERECPEYGTYRVALKKVTIRVVMEGLEMAPGPRPHDPIRERGETVKISDRSEVKNESSLGGGLKLSLGLDQKPDASINGEAAAKRSSTNTTTIERTNEITTRCVNARPGDRWEVQEPSGDVLQATYLTEADPLGNVVVKDRSNRRSVTATVEILQKDLQIDLVEGARLRALLPRKFQLNKDRLAAIVLADNLSAQLGDIYTGKIVLSCAEDECE